METAPTLRPLGMMQIIDRIFRLCRTNFWLFAGITAAVYVPFLLIYQVSGLPDYLLHQYLNVLPGSPVHVPSAPPNLALTILALFLGLIASPVCAAALVYAISQRYLERPVRLGQSYLYVLRRFGTLLLTLLSIYLVCAVVMAVPGGPLTAVFLPYLLHPAGEPPVAAMVITGVICLPLGLLLFLLLVPFIPFATIAFVVEEKRYFGAIARCLFLLRPWYWAQVLLVIFVVRFIAGFVVSALTVPAVLLMGLHSPDAFTGTLPHWFQMLMALINGLVSCVSLPLTSGVVILQYYDARIRKEGYDLSLMAQEMAASIPPPEAPPETTSADE